MVGKLQRLPNEVIERGPDTLRRSCASAPQNTRYLRLPTHLAMQKIGHGR